MRIFTGTSFLLCVVLTLSCQRQRPLLERLTPDRTGIDFANRIAENDTFNILDLEYVYNGGGVAVGDFNNDNLQDIYFTGNTAENRLYLNQGDFKFKDVTTQARVRGEGRWCSGVAAVDINADGLLDLYVCATVLTPGTRRSNLLYINKGLDENKVPVFEEMAASYGIADTSHTTNAVFFDYDNDGDLDLYLLVNEMEKQRQPNKYRPKITDGSSPRTDKLYRNERAGSDHPYFTDVSRSAGINIEGYGLGVGVCDINSDGWKDIYVCNDYLSNDLLWVNNGDGTFTDRAPEYFKHTSYSAMGNDVADINNDGRPDIIALDMLPEDNFRRKTMLPPVNYVTDINNDKFGYQYQYVRNTLQLNTGIKPGGKGMAFEEVAMLAGIPATDWSWAPLCVDIDNDGMRDLLITNGFPKDVTDRDFMDYHSQVGNVAFKEDLLREIPSVKIHNYVFRNTGGELPAFQDMSSAWGMTDPSFSNGAAVADLDNDGDLDYITNNINDSAFVYRNNLIEFHPDSAHWLKIAFSGSSQNPQGIGAVAELFYDNGKSQYAENTPFRGYLSTIESGVHFGLGKVQRIDSLRVTWANGKSQVLTNVKADQIVSVDITNAQHGSRQPDHSATLFTDITETSGIHYMHRDSDFIDFNFQRLLPHKLSQYGPGIAVGDVNGDGRDDIYVSGSRLHTGTFFVQSADGRHFEEKNLFAEGDLITKYEEELGVLLFDADNDGDNDLYIVSGSYELPPEDAGYQDRLFINREGTFVRDPDALPQFRVSGSCVRAADIDHDGDLDLFVAGRVVPGEYPRPLSSYVLINDSKPDQVRFAIANASVAPDLENIGMVCDALWTDYNNDSWPDLLIAGEWMGLKLFDNHNGALSPHKDSVLNAAAGWWNSLAAADFDLDGDIDYIAGNTGLNTIQKVRRLDDGQESYIAIYAADFDGNKGLDAVPSNFFPDAHNRLVEFPYFQRVDVEKQIVKVKGMYPKHADFGRATMADIVSKFNNIEPLVLKAHWLQTSYIENLGNGKFAITPLPVQAQVSPVFGVLCDDFNGDNFPDIVLTGNDFGTELGMGRFDAMNGVFLAGDGTGKFVAVGLDKSGLYVPGDAKSLVRVEMGDGTQVLVAGQNKNQALVFSVNTQGTNPIVPAPNDVAAIVTLNDGRTLRKEFYYGQGFLSQPTRTLRVLKDVRRIELVNSEGVTRAISGAENQ